MELVEFFYFLQTEAFQIHSHNCTISSSASWMKAGLTNVIWNLCPWQLLKELNRFFTMYFGFILLSVTVSSLQRITEMTSFLISSSECYSCFSGKVKAMNPSVKGNMLIPIVLCLLTEKWKTKMFYHEIMSCEIFS